MQCAHPKTTSRLLQKRAPTSFFFKFFLYRSDKRSLISVKLIKQSSQVFTSSDKVFVQCAHPKTTSRLLQKRAPTSFFFKFFLYRSDKRSLISVKLIKQSSQVFTSSDKVTYHEV